MTTYLVRVTRDLPNHPEIIGIYQPAATPEEATKLALQMMGQSGGGVWTLVSIEPVPPMVLPGPQA